MKKQAKLRPLGDVLLDLEVVLDEMVTRHGLQFGDVLALVYSHLEVHNPEAREVYTEDLSSPVLYYGPRKDQND